MRFISTRTHGIIDYLWGAILLAVSWRFGADAWIFLVFGAGAILYSLLTDYELGVFPVLSMRAHLTIDVLGGLLLAASPWIFAQGSGSLRILLPVFGLFSVMAGLTTYTEPRRHAALRRV